MAATTLTGIAVVLGYLLGSIPFGLVLTRAAGLGDVRKIGSGNIGATNVLRTGRKGLAAATLLLDMLKGTAAVLLALWLARKSYSRPQDAALVANAGLAAGLAAFLGHLYPAWLGFRGGKGVATYIGVLIGVAWQAAALFGAVWLAVAALSRYSSLSALVASVVTPLALWGFGQRSAAVVIAAMTALLWWRHRENIKRLMAGTESRIGGAKGGSGKAADAVE